MKDQFRTKLKVDRKKIDFTHRDVILTIGSCFSSHIGDRLGSLLYPTMVNPFGVLYNPISLENVLLYGVGDRQFSAEALTSSQGIWYSWEHHGQYSSTDRGELMEIISKGIERLKNHLSVTSVCIITLGSAWVYELLESGKIVANCHKHPSNLFEKRLLSIVEIEESISRMIQALRLVNCKIKIIFTLSPVRHLKDGFVENQLSKSSLLLGLHRSIQGQKDCNYFPSYEIMMDDLRDYRFYERDMIHPNEVAVNYIWEQFTHAFMSDREHQINQKITGFRLAAAHRPFHPYSAEHQKFLSIQLEQLADFEKLHPGINVKELESLFEQQLA